MTTSAGKALSEPTSVLVVDDDPDINLLIRTRLKSLGFQVTSASNGPDALDRLDEATPDLMLLDVSMPGMGGLDVLDRVRAAEMDIAVVMTTAFGTERVAIDTLRRGADDYLRKPFEPEEFRAVMARTATNLQLRRKNRELQRRIEIELRQAADIQARLLPDAPPALPGFEIAAHCEPAQQVGGDFYDWQLQPNGMLSFTLGDVMGKGMPAALLMTTVRSALRSVALHNGPAAGLHSVQHALFSDLERSRGFVTLFHARLDPDRAEVTYVDAGHGLVFVRHADGRTEALGPRGVPLGIVEDTEYQEGHFCLAPGDALVVYSDGLPDAHADVLLDHVALGEHIGCARSAVEIVERLTQLAEAGTSRHDDLSLLVVRHTQGPHACMPRGSPLTIDSRRELTGHDWSKGEANR